jgi:hypothetical protein
MTQFELRKDDRDNDALFKIEEDGTEWSIPMLEGNSDYQRYLNPEAEQSTPIVTSGE